MNTPRTLALTNKHLALVQSVPDGDSVAPAVTASLKEFIDLCCELEEGRSQEIIALKERNRELVADAERYRWLRANHETYDFDENLGQLSLWEHKKGIDYGMKSYAKLDAAIDSAMKPAKSQS